MQELLKLDLLSCGDTGILWEEQGLGDQYVAGWISIGSCLPGKPAAHRSEEEHGKGSEG